MAHANARLNLHGRRLLVERVIQAALRPVEALRSAADRISNAGQDTRLPVPASRDEIHDLAVTLNSMLDRLTMARARQRDFVADAAHELRSPSRPWSPNSTPLSGSGSARA